MNQKQRNIPPEHQRLCSGDPANLFLQRMIEDMQRKIEQQDRRLEQQDRRIEQLNQYTQKLRKEHTEQIQSQQLMNQQFTMHIQSQHLQIQQLFAMHAGGFSQPALGPPPPPNITHYPAPPLPAFPQNSALPPPAMTQNSVKAPRGERGRQRIERYRSRSPDRGDDRYPGNRRGDRSSPSKEVSPYRLGLLPSESRAVGEKDMGDAILTTFLPLRLKDNSRVAGGEARPYIKDELEDGKGKGKVKVESEIDG
ncbi:hypothetical protein NHQ30_002355 [Ciborinia camelliae]|nr:hypothetical protein NHQ30_002355 [Ciborinia camelliae]